MGGADRLASLIADQMNKPKGGAVLGQYLGDQVLLGGRTYPSDMAVDQDIAYGSYVWVVLSQDGIGVVVGS